MSNKGEIIYFNKDPSDECFGLSSAFSFLSDKKHIRIIPTTMHPRNTVNKRVFPVTLSPSCSYVIVHYYAS